MAAPTGNNSKAAPRPQYDPRFIAEMLQKVERMNYRIPMRGTPKAGTKFPEKLEYYAGFPEHNLAHKLATLITGMYLDARGTLFMLEKNDPLFMAHKREFEAHLAAMSDFLSLTRPDVHAITTKSTTARLHVLNNMLSGFNLCAPVKIEDAQYDDPDIDEELRLAADVAAAEKTGDPSAIAAARDRQKEAFKAMAAREREAQLKEALLKEAAAKQRDMDARIAEAHKRSAEAHQRQVDAAVKAANDAMAAAKAAMQPPPSAAAAAVAVTPAPAYAPSVQSVSFKVATPAAPAMVPVAAGRAQSVEERKKMMVERMAASAKAAKDQARAVGVGGGVIMAQKADVLDVCQATLPASEAIMERLAADVGAMQLGSILSRNKNSETGQLNPEHVQKEARQAKNQAQSDYKHVVAQYDGTFANLGKNPVAMPAGMFPVFCESVAAYAPAQLYVITDETGDDIPVVLSAVFERMRSIGKLSKSGAYDGQEKRRVRVYGSSIPEDVVALNCDTYRILGGQSKGGKDLAKQYERSIRRCLKTYHIESQRNVHASMAAGAASASVLPGNR